MTIITGNTGTNHNPEQLHIDSETGIFALTNAASETQSYTVDITVVTTDGYNSVTDTITSVEITTQCGQASTSLTSPIMNALTKSPKTMPVLSISGTVTSDNPTCPVTSHTLTQGSSNFYLTETGEVFTVAMTEDANRDEAAYPYEVTTTALGSAQTTTSSTMTIEKVCVADLEEFSGDRTVAIPETGHQTETLDFVATDYVSAPPPNQGCSQKFEYTMGRGLRVETLADAEYQAPSEAIAHGHATYVAMLTAIYGALNTASQGEAYIPVFHVDRVLPVLPTSARTNDNRLLLRCTSCNDQITWQCMSPTESHCPTEYGRANQTSDETEYVLLTLPTGATEVQIKVNNQYVLDIVHTN